MSGRSVRARRMSPPRQGANLIVAHDALSPVGVRDLLVVIQASQETDLLVPPGREDWCQSSRALCCRRIPASQESEKPL